MGNVKEWYSIIWGNILGKNNWVAQGICEVVERYRHQDNFKFIHLLPLCDKGGAKPNFVSSLYFKDVKDRKDIAYLEAVNTITDSIMDLKIEVDREERALESYKNNMKSTKTEHLEALTTDPDMTVGLAAMANLNLEEDEITENAKDICTKKKNLIERWMVNIIKYAPSFSVICTLLNEN